MTRDEIEAFTERMQLGLLSDRMRALMRRMDHVSHRVAALDWDESQHPRGQPKNAGQFAEKPGARPTGEGKVGEVPPATPETAVGKAPSTDMTKGGMHPGHGFSKGAFIDGQGNLHCATVEDAVIGLYQNAMMRKTTPTAQTRKVILSQKREVGTLVEKLASVAQDMIVNGGKDAEGNAVVFDLCDVAVEGTNLFCVESKGIPRIKMPQFENDEKQLAFVEQMKAKYGAVDEEELAGYLKATQNQLDGGKVAGIAAAMRKGDIRRSLRLVVSKEGYIVDGHHRWAAIVGNDALDGDLTQRMEITRVNLDIMTLLEEADAAGAGHADVGGPVVEEGTPGAAQAQKKKPSAPPAKAGKWTADGRQIGVEDIVQMPGIGKREVNVIKNPTLDDIHDAVAAAEIPEQGVRILKADDGNIFMWDAYDAVHADMAQALGIKDYHGEGERGAAKWTQIGDMIYRESDGSLKAIMQDGPQHWASTDFREHQRAADAWVESEHPRGQPENKGQFVEKGKAAALQADLEELEASMKAYLKRNQPPEHEHPEGWYEFAAAKRDKLKRQLAGVQEPRPSFEFVSPNIREGTKLREAKVGLKSARHKFITSVSEEVDKALELETKIKPVIGMWADGAENSTMAEYADISWDQLVASAAMKGWLAKQKQVLVFKEGETDPSHGQEAALLTFRAAGEAGEISDWLVSHGLPYHTLEPISEGHFAVHVYSGDEATEQAVEAAGENYGSDIVFRHGRGDFIGTTKQDGTDAEQRADARQVYEGAIAQSGLQGAAAKWQGLRDRYGRKADEVVSDQTDTPQFKHWFGESKIVDENGQPKVVYHGTRGTFTAFDPARTNIEDNWGKGFYFTDDPKDVSRNYASEQSPDIEARINELTEQLAEGNDEWEYEKARRAAEKMLGIQHAGAVLPVFLKMENPLVIDMKGDKGTTLDFSEPYDEASEEYGEATGKAVEFTKALREVVKDFDDQSDGGVERYVEKIMEYSRDYGALPANKIEQLALEAGDFGSIYDSEGKIASSEIIRRALQKIGFDGIVDRRVAAKFPGLIYNDKTAHYIVFDPHQIKSATGNVGTFDPEKTDVGDSVALDREWREEEHPRGQPENAGQFVEKGVVGQVREVLTPDLLTPMWKKKIGAKPKCKSAGHCYAAAEAAYHMLGGSEAGYTAKLLSSKEWPDGLAKGETHWFLRHKSGRIVDPTADQFDKAVPYDKGRGIGFLTKKPSRRAKEIIKRAKKQPGEQYAFQKPTTSGSKATRWESIRNEGGHEVEIAVNPTYDDIVKLGGRGGEVRLLRNPQTGDIMVWPSGDAIHETVAQRMGVPLATGAGYADQTRVAEINMRGLIRSNQRLGDEWIRPMKAAEPVREGHEPSLFPKWLSEHDLAYVKGTVENVLPRLRYPKERITYKNEPIGAFVGGEWLDATAMADSVTGEITVGLPAMRNLGPKGIGGIMAHEVEHQKFNQFLRGKEAPKLLTPDFQRGLAAYDGITPYSASVWQQMVEGKLPDMLRPIHETLAEMARLQFEGEDIVARAPPNWKKLYESVEQRYRPPKGPPKQKLRGLGEEHAFSNVEYVSGPKFKDVEVITNPTLDDLHRVANEADTKQVRVMRMRDGRVLAWDADKALHEWMWEALEGDEGDDINWLKNATIFGLHKGKLKSEWGHEGLQQSPEVKDPKQWAAADDFDPSEPRVPAGHEGGGQWTKGGAAAPATKPEEKPAASTAEPRDEDLPLDKVMEHLGVAEEMMRDAREAGQMDMIPHLRMEVARYRALKDKLVKAQHEAKWAALQKEWDAAEADLKTDAEQRYVNDQLKSLPAEATVDQRKEAAIAARAAFAKEPIRIKHAYLKEAEEEAKLQAELMKIPIEIVRKARELWVQQKIGVTPEQWEEFSEEKRKGNIGMHADEWWGEVPAKEKMRLVDEAKKFKKWEDAHYRERQRAVELYEAALPEGQREKAIKERAFDKLPIDDKLKYLAEVEAQIEREKPWKEANTQLKDEAQNLFVEDRIAKGPAVKTVDAEAEFEALPIEQKMEWLKKADEARPAEWDDLDSDQQEEARKRYVEQQAENVEGELENLIENWREGYEPLEQAKYELAHKYDNQALSDLDWFTDALDGLREKIEEGILPPVPYTNEQLWKAIKIDYEGDGEGGNDPTITFDDSKLTEPAGFDPSPVLPGIEPEDPSKRLTDDHREFIRVALVDAFNEQADDDQGRLSAPTTRLREEAEEAAAERAEEGWDDLEDRRKFNWYRGPKRSGAGINIAAGTVVKKKGNTEWRYVPFVAKRYNPGDLPKGEVYEVEMAVNPTRRDVEDIMRHSRRKVMRMLRDQDGNIYAWDATTVTHHEVIENMGLPMDPDDLGDDTRVIWRMEGVGHVDSEWFRDESGDDSAEVDEDELLELLEAA